LADSLGENPAIEFRMKSRSAMAPSEPNVILDDFVVERKLGEGGMGTVSLVRSRTSGEQFAVKTTLLRDEVSRRNFLVEIQSWVDLPDNPHLTRFRFFRTVADEITVFAEYVDGGSLKDWIRDRKLTRLEQILDVAIQVAWGLHAAHEVGLVHQDLKPGNVLLTTDGVAKVTDFGLARARGLVGEHQTSAGQSILVSYGGMTPAYCSPEQAARQPLSHKTDVWSWGVSVLELFMGEVSWKSGTLAMKVLDGLLKAGREDGLPPMPSGVADVLRMCFCASPKDRWASLEEAAQHLQEVYKHETGRDYCRQKPASAVRSRSKNEDDDRLTAQGAAWADPHGYLREAQRYAGWQDSDAEPLRPRGRSRRAQAIADLALYEEARLLFRNLVGGGRNDLESRLASLCHHKALLHGHMHDLQGQLAMYEEAIAIYERLVNVEGRRELAPELATVYMDKAVAVRISRDKRGSVALLDQAIGLYQRLVNQQGRSDLSYLLAIAYMNKAIEMRLFRVKRLRSPPPNSAPSHP
jgi:tetratricopeptide (TPR) repeat protein